MAEQLPEGLIMCLSILMGQISEVVNGYIYGNGD